MAGALLHRLEGVHVESLALSVLFNETTTTPEAFIVNTFKELRRRKPCILFVPDIYHWHSSVSFTVWNLLKSQLEELNANDAIFLLATAHFPCDDSDPEQTASEIKDLFRDNRLNIGAVNTLYNIDLPSFNDRRAFFELILQQEVTSPHPALTLRDDGMYDLDPNILLPPAKVQNYQPLPKAPEPPVKKLTAKEIRYLHEYDQSVFRRLRIMLREFMHELIRYKDYKAMTKNLNVRDFIIEM